ncbi:MAG: benzoate/H(+) symporter BenE family transporter [bacterium]|nr:benzoate/H(+) symporter BenE family transporter [bacterium]
MELRPPETGFWRNLRDLPRALTLSGFIAGFIVVLIGYTGPLLIVLQAGEAGGLTQAQTTSWLWAVTVGNGLLTMFLSIYYRQPIIAPWPTAGAALLVTSLANYTLPQAIGAYLVAALGLVVIGATGIFGTLIARVPRAVVQGLLAGILLRFGIGIFRVLPQEPLLVTACIVVFFLLKRRRWRAPTLGVLVVGVVIAALSGDLNISGVNIALARPIITLPEFMLEAMLSLALPLCILAVTTQFAPGEAVLRSAGYRAPVNGIMVFIGLGSIPLAFLGGHGQSLGALTSALVASPDVSPDHSRRYAAAVASGAWYTLFGLFGATIISFFAGFPAALVAVIAGLSLSGTIASSLSGAMEQPDTRDAALVAFLCAAGEFSLFGIGAPFWGLVAGVAVYWLMRPLRRPVVVEAGSPELQK